MKKVIILIVVLLMLLACTPLVKSSKLDDAIQKTMQAEELVGNAIQTGIAQTLAAAVTLAPPATNTPQSTETLSVTNPPEMPLFTETSTQAPYVSPTVTLNPEVTLEIINKCDKTVNIKITGPVTYSATIPGKSEDKRQIPRGTYHFWSDSGRDFDYTLSVHHWVWYFCKNANN